MNPLQQFFPMGWKPLVEIGLLWFAFYLLFVYIKDSGMAQALKTIVFLVVLFVVAQVLRLDAIRWILSHLFQISVLGFAIVFHPELRRGLARLGQSPLFRLFLKEMKTSEALVDAVFSMSRAKIGALIAIEREMTLKPYTETGVALDAVLTSELILTVFAPNTPLHDGGVVVQESRLAAAGCLFPLSQNPKLAKSLGTRHRAAIGLSEETDALVIAVSEETGIVSTCTQGRITREVSEEKLREYLAELYEPPKTGLASKGRRHLAGRAA